MRHTNEGARLVLSSRVDYRHPWHLVLCFSTTAERSGPSTYACLVGNRAAGHWCSRDHRFSLRPSSEHSTRCPRAGPIAMVRRCASSSPRHARRRAETIAVSWTLIASRAGARAPGGVRLAATRSRRGHRSVRQAQALARSSAPRPAGSPRARAMLRAGADTRPRAIDSRTIQNGQRPRWPDRGHVCSRPAVEALRQDSAW